MLDLLMRFTRHRLLLLIQLPMSVWINYQWVEMRYRETCHLLRLDDYLLKDMGLRRVDGRIEAIDAARIESRHAVSSIKGAARCDCERYRHAN